MGYRLLWRFVETMASAGVLWVWDRYVADEDSPLPSDAFMGFPKKQVRTAFFETSLDLSEARRKLRYSHREFGQTYDKRLVSILSFEAVPDDPHLAMFRLREVVSSSDDRLLEEHEAEDWVDLYQKTGDAGAVIGQYTIDVAIVPTTFANLQRDIKHMDRDGWYVYRLGGIRFDTDEEAERIVEVLWSRFRGDPKYTNGKNYEEQLRETKSTTKRRKLAKEFCKRNYNPVLQALALVKTK